MSTQIGRSYNKLLKDVYAQTLVGLKREGVPELRNNC